MRLTLAFGSLALGIVACSTTSDLARDSRNDGGDGRDARASSGGAAGGGGSGQGASGAATGGAAASGGTTASGGATTGGGGGAADASLDGGVATDASIDAGAADARPDARAPGELEWQLFYDRSFAAHVEVDSKGAAIVSGTFFDTKDVTLGATTLKSHGAADVMLSRVLPGGGVDWARGYGGVAEDYPVSFALGAGDRIALVGLYDGTGNVGGPDFPAFAGAAGRYDVYVASLTASGDHLWSKTLNTTSESFGGPGLALNAAGSVLVPGYFAGSLNDTGGGVPQASAGSFDGYLARFDEPSGAYSGAVTFGAAGDDRAVAALFTGADLVVVGQFHGAVTFPTVPSATLVTSNGGSDVFVARASSVGVLSSVVSFGGTGDETVANARLDASGNVVLAGVFDSPSLSVLGGSALATAGGKDFYVAKLSPTLSHVWSRRFGGDADDLVRDVAVGPGGVVAITGEFRDRLTIGADVWNASRLTDGGPSAIDLFFAKLGADGAPLWSFAAGGPLPDRGLGIAMDAQGAVYATASFQSPVDFGSGKVLTPDPGQWASALVRYAP